MCSAKKVNSLKRKRAAGHDTACGAVSDRRTKRQKGVVELQDADAAKHALLAQYYPQVLTLRAYVLAKLPPSSKIRRKKIAALGSPNQPPRTETEARLSQLLDSTLVATPGETAARPAETREPDDRWRKWISYSQKGDESYVTLSDGVSSAYFSQSEIVDFVIWILFEREKKHGGWPRNLLTDGFRRSAVSRAKDGDAKPANPIPGLYCHHPNGHVEVVKADPWPQLLTLLGKAGEKIMMDLLMDCSIFLSIEAGHGNYHQLSGLPIVDAAPLIAGAVPPGVVMRKDRTENAVKSPSEIAFVRSRILYARAPLNSHGGVHFGLRHIRIADVLNRFPQRSRSQGKAETASKEGAEGSLHSHVENTVRVMMYIFPRQFGLHNVFTSTVDRKKSAQKFQDYVLREEEIQSKFGPLKDNSKKPRIHIPKRLRGPARYLVERLQILHSRCSYNELLQHYCPIDVERFKPDRLVNTKSAVSSEQLPKGSNKTCLPSVVAGDLEKSVQHSDLSELATPIAHVSAFCQAVFKKILPNEFWGAGETQLHNKDMFLRNVDHFVRLRRFEMMSLHEMMQGLKVTEIEWLAPPGLVHLKASQTDLQKRKEIFLEYLYYLVDSMLMPLIRSHFYVTESNIHRYRLFFFRHDVWRYIAEPAMSALKANMFEEVKLSDALRILESRQLGFSQVRLLPKQCTMRPIMNLRRRTLASGNKQFLGPSINTILGPVHAMLNLERTQEPQCLGSAMFSVGDMYPRIKEFKQRLGPQASDFYFAKVDVQKAFETIPQAAVLQLMSKASSHAHYTVVKHCELKANSDVVAGGPKSARRWRSWAKATGDETPFIEMAEKQFARNKKNTVFVDSVVQKPYDTRALLALMASHIQQNLVKVGKKYYRQKEGIPQGSILSSILCSYFYAQLEKEHLSFLQSDDCLLLRLIDDFLLITTDKSKAVRFVQVMHGGLPAYGVQVNPSKSLVNFAMATDASATPVPRTQQPSSPFPYCGTRLCPRTLDLSKDHGQGQARDPVAANALTVEFPRHPGQHFRRKVLNAFKIHSHLMFFDTAHNAPRTAVRNLHAAFAETATKMWAYARCLGPRRRPASGLVVGAIRELVDAAFLLLTSRSRARRYPGYECAVNKTQVRWVAAHAFLKVLGRKQTGYGEVIEWLREEKRALEGSKELRMPKRVLVD